MRARAFAVLLIEANREETRQEFMLAAAARMAWTDKKGWQEYRRSMKAALARPDAADEVSERNLPDPNLAAIEEWRKAALRDRARYGPPPEAKPSGI